MGGLHFGGDTLITVYDENDNMREVKAGQLLSAAIGVRFDISESLEMPITFGIKADAARYDSDNNGGKGDVRFNRFPLNTLLLYKLEAWRFGAGLTYHINPKYTDKSDYYNYTAEFENALGYLAEMRYFFSDNAYVGSRYTNIEYELKNSSTGRKYDGSSIGVVLGANL